MRYEAAHRRAGFARLLVGAFVLFASPLSTTTASAADLRAGEHALAQGRAAEAIADLRAVLATDASNGQAHLLLCRTYYAEQLPDPAVAECETALGTLSKDSVAQDWMGRAYGLKAGHSSMLSGFSLAKKVRASFEAAVNLDFSNGEAVDDLGEYYVAAPSIVGGGLDKADALAARAQAKHPQRALRIRALAAEKRKDYAAAEQLFRSRVEASGGGSDTWIDLGGYYGRRSQLDKALDALHHAYAAEKAKGSPLVGLAVELMAIKRDPELAAKALQDYLSGQHWDETAPTFKAHTLLANLLAARGDKAAAKLELGKALTLAPDYEPAKKALASLQGG